MLTAGQTFGVNVGTQAAGAGFGLLSTLVGNKLARDNADHDREQNYLWNEKAAERADWRTRRLYADLYSPKAQLEQIKAAGLSPSVFYANGAGGISGSTGAQGEGASGIRQETFGIPNITPLDMSQIALNQSIARKNNADANITEKSTEEQIKSFFLENTNRKLRNEYMEWENSRKAIEINLLSSYGEQEYESKLNKIAAETKKLLEETRKAQVESDVAEQTKQEQIEFIRNQNYQLLADITLKRSQTELTNANVNLSNAQAKELIERIAQKWNELGIEASKLDFDYDKLEAQVKQWAIENDFKKKDQWITIAQTIIAWRHGEKKLLIDTIGAFGALKK